ncbi:uncharacterized protein LOC120357021 [Solenopsis invicta]|uniref:uncharacterized protein LOC120357021 n=1 Tax=Solenopsis invicta TaxID=13686 RepID=UPI00193DC6E0|nr:uncharacterized protein LOC120357021 [Solenopsis invicta]
MCHNTNNWMDVLPTVLLGLQTSFKEDIKATAAELVYGQTLQIPSEFFMNEDQSKSPHHSVKRLRQHIRKIRPVPSAHHCKKKRTKHCTHVFRVDAVRKPLEQSYEGPYEVLDRPSDNVFLVNVKGQHTYIATERIKPAFFELLIPESNSAISNQNLETTETSTLSTSAEPNPGRKKHIKRPILQKYCIRKYWETL